MLKTKAKELKDAVREWVSTLSVEEIIVNGEISKIFKNIEHKFELLEVTYV